MGLIVLRCLNPTHSQERLLIKYQVRRVCKSPRRFFGTLAPGKTGNRFAVNGQVLSKTIQIIIAVFQEHFEDYSQFLVIPSQFFRPTTRDVASVLRASSCGSLLIRMAFSVILLFGFTS